LITRIIFNHEYISWNYSIRNLLQSPLISWLFGPNILLRILFSNTLSLSSSFDVRDQVSHPYRITSKL
jgi:hypothetical protein